HRIPNLGYDDRVYQQRPALAIAVDADDAAECLADSFVVLCIRHGCLLRASKTDLGPSRAGTCQADLAPVPAWYRSDTALACFHLPASLSLRPAVHAAARTPLVSGQFI